MATTRFHLSHTERLSRLRLLRSETIGSVTFHALLGRFGSALAVIERWPAIARRLRQSGPPLLAPVEDIERELEALANFGATLLAHDEVGYPQPLAAADAPPPLLALKGNTALLATGIIGVVGSRNASAIGQRFARDIAAEICHAGFAVVSGLARGIDTAAHRGSLPGGTIAVLAGGIDVIYPPENTRLAEEIGEKGLLISEVRFGQQPTAAHFPRRNRIISGLSRGVLVVEATLNSGSLITARLAAEQGREVFAVPGSPLDPRARGTNALLRQGATLTESVDDILSVLQPTLIPRPPVTTRPAASPVALLFAENCDDLRAEILHRLSRTPVELNELIRLTGAPPAAVSAALMDLEFAGLLTRHPGQMVSLGLQS